MNNDYSNLNRIKILIIGPSNSGKSSIANFIAERSDVLKPNYHPTVGCRILEFEKEAPRHPKRPGQEKVLVELWDVSGDPKYDRTWPAIQQGAHGCILTYNAESSKQEAEMEGWLSAFPKKMKLPVKLLMGFAHHPSGTQIKYKSKPPKGMDAISIYDTSIEEGTSTIHPNFDKFFANLMLISYERQEKEENQLIQDY